MRDSTDFLLMRGLGLLMDPAHNAFCKAFDVLMANAMPLEKHPFSLGITTNLPKDERLAVRSKKIFFLGSPFLPESMIQSLTRVAQFLASDYDPMDPDPPVRYIRKIGIGRRQFFEMGSTYGVFLVGGCDICTSGGNVTGQHLEQLLSFLERVYSVPFLVSVFNEKEMSEKVWRLSDQYQDFERHRFEKMYLEA